MWKKQLKYIQLMSNLHRVDYYLLQDYYIIIHSKKLIVDMPH